MDYVYTVSYPVMAVHADCFGRCKPSSIFRFAQEAAGEHCRILGADWETLSKKHYFWAIIRQKMEIKRLPMVGEQVNIRTWPMPSTRVAYPRATEGYDSQGNLLFRLIGLWVIMDNQTRAMVLPGKSGVTVPGVSFGTELKAPAGLPSWEGGQEGQRRVAYSDLDINGHMNNTRYLDWICDLLPADFHKDHPLKEATVCYMTEAREGQNLHLRWNPEQPLLVDGIREDPEGPTRIFCAKLDFGSVL